MALAMVIFFVIFLGNICLITKKAVILWAILYEI
jgi:hypothetical protein